jgi:hypothetical protein
MLLINVWLLLSGTTPDNVPIGSILVSGLLSFSAFLVLAAIMLRRRELPTAAEAARSFASRSS